MPRTNVLLVEDDKSDAFLIKERLCGSGQFLVSHVKTLTAACHALCNGHAIDVVVLDLGLPDAGGLATFTRLHEHFPEMPVVILSGNEDEELAITAVAQGAQDYVPKNMADAAVLVRSLRYAIERNGRRLAERRNLLMERDLAAARQIQQHVLPAGPPCIEGFDVAGVCWPADACSGDFFDYIPGNGGRWDLVIADVSGHGLAPALIMFGTRRTLRNSAQRLEDVGEILAMANRAAVEESFEDQFITVFFARVDPAARTLTYASAAHQAFVLNRHGVPTTLNSTGMPLGIASGSTYEVGDVVTLQSGDIVLMMTDGACDAKAPDGELFDHPRVFELVQQHRDRTAAEILNLLFEAIRGFCHPGQPFDDVTMVLVKVG